LILPRTQNVKKDWGPFGKAYKPEESQNTSKEKRFPDKKKGWGKALRQMKTETNRG